jgi:uncharacterized protein (DUF433 family)
VTGFGGQTELTPAGRRRRLAIARLAAVKPSSVVHSDPEILGGTPVFIGTRVPVQALIDYIEGGHTLEKFLEDFPSVPRELAIAALEQAKRHLIADARAA